MSNQDPKHIISTSLIESGIIYKNLDQDNNTLNDNISNLDSSQLQQLQNNNFQSNILEKKTTPNTQDVNPELYKTGNFGKLQDSKFLDQGLKESSNANINLQFEQTFKPNNLKSNQYTFEQTANFGSLEKSIVFNEQKKLKTKSILKKPAQKKKEYNIDDVIKRKDKMQDDIVKKYPNLETLAKKYPHQNVAFLKAKQEEEENLKKRQDNLKANKEKYKNWLKQNQRSNKNTNNINLKKNKQI